MDVGFFGLGNMGKGMARSLLRAGHTVTVYNRTRSRAEELAAEGARVAGSPADACGGDVVITMLADDRAVEDVVLGEGRLVSAMVPGKLHISMSTISVALTERLAQAHRNAGQQYVAAPVFGRPEAAATAKLFIIAAGAANAVERCRVVFEALGQKTFVVGGNPAAASVIKLSGNFLVASAIESLGEAMALVRKAGIDPMLYLDVLTNTAFTSPFYKIYGSQIAKDQFEPAGFKVPLGLKDLRLALAAADGLAVPMPMASLIRDQLLSAVARGYQEMDWSVVGRVSAENAGL